MDLSSSRIFVMNKDGTGLREVSGRFSGSSFAPRFLPSGKIAFVNEDRGDYNLYIIGEDGNDLETV